MTAISNEHYIHNNTINHCESADYIQTIIHHGKAAALSTLSVLVIAYQNVDSELHHNLNDPTELMISTFIKDIKAKKPIWFDLYAQHQYMSYSMNHMNALYSTNQLS